MLWLFFYFLSLSLFLFINISHWYKFTFLWPFRMSPPLPSLSLTTYFPGPFISISSPGSYRVLSNSALLVHCHTSHPKSVFEFQKSSLTQHILVPTSSWSAFSLVQVSPQNGRSITKLSVVIFCAIENDNSHSHLRPVSQQEQ